MAEGLLRELSGDRFESLSAGSRPTGLVHPLAVSVMQEIGVDISAHHSKSLNEFLPPHGQPPDVVISVCDSAARDCPTLPGNVQRLHWPFDDPANAEGSDAEKLPVFRRVRDEITSAIKAWLSTMD
jgi:arsenate reductase